MRILRDRDGLAVRLTEERLAHILEHPEMREMVTRIEETLRDPVKVVTSRGDPGARLYYRLYTDTVVGEKYLCVVVQESSGDSFILTAYLTDRIKRGSTIWPEET